MKDALDTKITVTFPTMEKQTEKCLGYGVKNGFAWGKKKNNN